MCGFIGKFSNQNFDNHKLKEANELIVCRGPDSTKFVSNCSNNLKYSMIFNRLSILDLSENANQPMISKKNNNVLMFNGEIYNHVELKKYLLNKNCTFVTNHSDTEVILNGLELEGTSFINRLRGQFAISYFDILNNKLYLIRDRVGQKPLYYFKDNKELIYGSNLKALLKLNLKNKINQNNLDEYIRYGSVGADRTLFNNFFKVEPAEIVEFQFENEEINTKKSKYWEIKNFIDNRKFSEEEFYSILDNSVNLRYEADVPIACFLSGGLDSTTITKLLSKNHNVNTFSLISNQKYDESNWSNLVAKKYRTNHQVVNIDNYIKDEDIFNSLNSLDEPYDDPSVIPSFILSREISKYFKVALSGDGGDELLGGYRRTYLSLNRKNINKNLISMFFKLYPSYFGTGSKILSNSKDPEISYSSTLSDEKLITLLNRNTKIFNNNIKLLDNVELYKALLLCDYSFYLPDQMLYKIDRTSMANSLEIRSPFVDHNLIEYIFSSSIQYLDFNNPKNILKKYLINDFNSEFLNRPKQGFVFNLENWVFSNLNLINDFFSIGQIVNVEFTNPIKKLSIVKSRINALRIWRLFVLENYLSKL